MAALNWATLYNETLTQNAATYSQMTSRDLKRFKKFGDYCIWSETNAKARKSLSAHKKRNECTYALVP